MSKTVKEIAELLGVSKTAIRKHMTVAFREKHIKVDATGRLLIDEQGCEILGECTGSRPSSPANQTANPVETTANQTANPVETTANQTANPVETTANQTANPVETTANQTANPVETTANQTANPVTVEVDGQNRLYEILESELQAKNKQIAAQQAEIANLQGELSAERQHSREQAERIAVLADQAQRLQLAQMSPQLNEGGGGVVEPAEPESPKTLWSRLFGGHR